MSVVIWLLFSLPFLVAGKQRESAYDRAVRHYDAAEWQAAIDAFEIALADYSAWKDDLVACYKTCGNEPWTINEATDDFEPKTIASLVEMSDCASACYGEAGDGRAGAGSIEILRRADDYRTRAAYHYLQFCYYSIGNLERAVQAAHTYVEANFEDKVMDRNLDFYEKADGYSPTFAVSMEPSHYLSLYFKGVSRYEKKDYKECASLFEAALQAYYHEVDLCHAMCQIVPRQSAAAASSKKKKSSFIDVISRAFKDLLRCRLNCSDGAVGYKTGLSDRDGYERMHYHYLQFCYFKLGLVQDALATSLLYAELKPDDEVMQSNIVFYKSKIGPGVKPRKEIVHIRQRRREAKLLAQTPMTETETDTTTTTVEEDDEPLGPFSARSSAERQSSIPKKKASLPTRDDSYHASPSNWTIDYDNASTGKRTVDDDVILLLPPPGQEKLERVVAEGLLTERNCEQLVKLAEVGAQPGDGYGANAHPHTTFEKFEGLDILDAAESARDGRLDRVASRLYLDAAEKSRALVEKQLRLNRTLYLTYTHLVCRTALELRGDEREATELSHPVHSDNCIIRRGGRECAKVAPAYTWRDYSAILYLNDDFVGGDFFWAHTNLTIETTVRPKCGRLVGFDGGHYHGVTGIASGKRCAVALWFTLDPEHEEKASQKARKIFADLKDSTATAPDRKDDDNLRSNRTHTEF